MKYSQHVSSQGRENPTIKKVINLREEFCFSIIRNFEGKMQKQRRKWLGFLSIYTCIMSSGGCMF